MALDPNRWTHKTQEAFAAALDRAKREQPTPRSPPTTCSRPCSPGRQLVLPICRSSASPRSCCATGPTRPSPRCRKAYGGETRAWAASSTDVLEHADDEPQRAARRLPVDRAPAARAGRPARASTREELLAALRDVRGQPPGHEPEPRGAVPGARALRPRPHRGGRARASSTRSSAATTRSAASSRCCRAAPRTTRCSSASPASARPPSSRGSPVASSRATCPRA